MKRRMRKGLDGRKGIGIGKKDLKGIGEKDVKWMGTKVGNRD